MDLDATQVVLSSDTAQYVFNGYCTIRFECARCIISLPQHMIESIMA